MCILLGLSISGLAQAHQALAWYNIFLSQQNSISRLISRKNHQPNNFIIISIIFTKDTIVALAQYDM
jgi:hypothetical protein